MDSEAFADGGKLADLDLASLGGRAPEGGVKVGPSIQPTSFYLSGFLCVVSAVLKLTTTVHWSWWRVLLPVWVVLGHQALYLAVGFIWLFFAEATAGEEVTVRQDGHPDGYLLAALLCFLIFADNLLGQIEGPGATVWFSLRSRPWELISVSGVFSVVCQLLFWIAVVRTSHHRTRGE